MACQAWTEAGFFCLCGISVRLDNLGNSSALMLCQELKKVPCKNYKTEETEHG